MHKSTYNVDLTLSPVPAASAPGTRPGMGRRSDRPTEKDRTGSGSHRAKESRQKGGKKATRKVESSSSSSSSEPSTSSEDDDEHQPLGIRQALEPWRYPLYAPSASFRMLDVLSGSHQFTLSGFSLARSMGCGTRLCSEFFEVAGMMFRLEVYPSGYTADTRRYISAFLTTPGAINPNHLLYEVAVLDQSGRDRHITVSRGCHNERNGPMLAHCHGVVAAVPRLAKARELEEHPKRYLPNDMLVVRATVQILRGWSGPPISHAATGGAAHPGIGTEYTGPYGNALPARAPQMHAFTPPGFPPSSSISMSGPLYSNPLAMQSRPSVGSYRGIGEPTAFAGLGGVSVPHAQTLTAATAHIDPVPAASFNWHSFPAVHGYYSPYVPQIPPAGLVPGRV